MAFRNLAQLFKLSGLDHIHHVLQSTSLRCNLRTGLATVTLALLAGGCSVARPAAGPARAASPVAAPWSQLCPPVIGGADVMVEKGDGRVVLAVTSIPTMADDVYDRVERLGAALPTPNGSRPRAARVSVSRLENGARLLLEPASAGEGAQLAEDLAALLDEMRSGGCPRLPPPPQAERPSPHDAHQSSGHHH